MIEELQVQELLAQSKEETYFQQPHTYLVVLLKKEQTMRKSQGLPPQK